MILSEKMIVFLKINFNHFKNQIFFVHCQSHNLSICMAYMFIPEGGSGLVQAPVKKSVGVQNQRGILKVN